MRKREVKPGVRVKVNCELFVEYGKEGVIKIFNPITGLVKVTFTEKSVTTDGMYSYLDLVRIKDDKSTPLKCYKLIKEFPGYSNLTYTEDEIKHLKNDPNFHKYFKLIPELPKYKIGDIVAVRYSGNHCSGWSESSDRDHAQILKISYFRDKEFYFPLKGREQTVIANRYYVAFEDNSIVFSGNTLDEINDYIVRRATKEEIENYINEKESKKIVIYKIGVQSAHIEITKTATEIKINYIRPVNGKNSVTYLIPKYLYYIKSQIFSIRPHCNGICYSYEPLSIGVRFGEFYDIFTKNDIIRILKAYKTISHMV